jgi:UDP-N-acetyl-D-mannosaminuronate dehydrogenase|tara:strand:- start:150 stop:299 length:150 start_codon:yes stop_codon:yes gene_type:complete
MKKDVVAGLGEIGLPMQKLLSRIIPVVGYDKKIELINAKKLKYKIKMYS